VAHKSTELTQETLEEVNANCGRATTSSDDIPAQIEPESLELDLDHQKDSAKTAQDGEERRR
jgi:hypothetical protein